MSNYNQPFSPTPVSRTEKSRKYSYNDPPVVGVRGISIRNQKAQNQNPVSHSARLPPNQNQDERKKRSNSQRNVTQNQQANYQRLQQQEAIFHNLYRRNKSRSFIGTSQSETSNLTNKQETSPYDKFEILKFECHELNDLLKTMIQQMEVSSSQQSTKAQLKDMTRQFKSRFEGVISDWDSIFEILTEEMNSTAKKHLDLKKELSMLKLTQEVTLKQRELEKGEYARLEQEFQETCVSLKQTFDQSKKILHGDLNEMELQIQDLKQTRQKMNLRHLDILSSVEKEVENDIGVMDGFFSKSGKVACGTFGESNSQRRAQSNRPQTTRAGEIDVSWNEFVNKKQQNSPDAKIKNLPISPISAKQDFADSKSSYHPILNQSPNKDPNSTSMQISESQISLLNQNYPTVGTIEISQPKFAEGFSNETSQSELPMPAIALAFGGQAQNNQGSFDEAMEEESKLHTLKDTRQLGKFFKKEIEIYNQLDDTVDQVFLKQLLNIRAPTADFPEQSSVDTDPEKSLALTTPRQIQKSSSDFKNATVQEFSGNPQIQEIMRSSKESYQLLNSSQKSKIHRSQENLHSGSQKKQKQVIPHSRKSKNHHVELDELMNVSNDFIMKESPLPLLDSIKNFDDDQLRDVNIEDLLKAPSLSISIQTVSDKDLLDEQLSIDKSIDFKFDKGPIRSSDARDLNNGTPNLESISNSHSSSHIRSSRNSEYVLQQHSSSVQQNTSGFATGKMQSKIIDQSLPLAVKQSHEPIQIIKEFQQELTSPSQSKFGHHRVITEESLGTPMSEPQYSTNKHGYEECPSGDVTNRMETASPTSLLNVSSRAQTTAIHAQLARAYEQDNDVLISERSNYQDRSGESKQVLSNPYQNSYDTVRASKWNEDNHKVGMNGFSSDAPTPNQSVYMSNSSIIGPSGASATFGNNSSLQNVINNDNYTTVKPQQYASNSFISQSQVETPSRSIEKKIVKIKQTPREQSSQYLQSVQQKKKANASSTQSGISNFKNNIPKQVLSARGSIKRRNISLKRQVETEDSLGPSSNFSNQFGQSGDMEGLFIQNYDSTQIPTTSGNFSLMNIGGSHSQTRDGNYNAYSSAQGNFNQNRTTLEDHTNPGGQKKKPVRMIDIKKIKRPRLGSKGNPEISSLSIASSNGEGQTIKSSRIPGSKIILSPAQSINRKARSPQKSAATTQIETNPTPDSFTTEIYSMQQSTDKKITSLNKRILSPNQTPTHPAFLNQTPHTPQTPISPQTHGSQADYSAPQHRLSNLIQTKESQESLLLSPQRNLGSSRFKNLQAQSEKQTASRSFTSKRQAASPNQMQENFQKLNSKKEIAPKNLGFGEVGGSRNRFEKEKERRKMDY